MLPLPGTLPSGSEWSFELKWDGFWAILSTEDGLQLPRPRGDARLPTRRTALAGTSVRTYPSATMWSPSQAALVTRPTQAWPCSHWQKLQAAKMEGAFPV